MSKHCQLKIAAYNIWNNEQQSKREKYILQELYKTEADAAGLQEVTQDLKDRISGGKG